MARHGSVLHPWVVPPGSASQGVGPSLAAAATPGTCLRCSQGPCADLLNGKHGSGEPRQVGEALLVGRVLQDSAPAHLSQGHAAARALDSHAVHVHLLQYTCHPVLSHTFSEPPYIFLVSGARAPPALPHHPHHTVGIRLMH